MDQFPFAHNFPTDNISPTPGALHLEEQLIADDFSSQDLVPENYFPLSNDDTSLASPIALVSPILRRSTRIRQPPTWMRVM